MSMRHRQDMSSLARCDTQTVLEMSNLTNQLVNRFRPARRRISPTGKDGFLHRDWNTKC